MSGSLPAAVHSLLREAAEWRLMGLLFECPSDDWRRQIAINAAEAADPDLRAAASHAVEEGDEGTYHSIFGPGGPAPAREATWHESMELGYLMSELSICYQAFAYTPTAAEPPDHVAVEAGFVAYLKLKEAFATAEGEDAKANVARDAAATFIRDRMASMGEPLGALLADSGVAYLALAGKALARRTGPKPQPLRADKSHFPILEPDSTFDCAEDPLPV